jgi:hypothetical protein
MTNLCFRDVAVGSERIFQGSVRRAPRQSSNEAPKLLVYRHDTLKSRVWKTKKAWGKKNKKKQPSYSSSSFDCSRLRKQREADNFFESEVKKKENGAPNPKSWKDLNGPSYELLGKWGPNPRPNPFIILTLFWHLVHTSVGRFSVFWENLEGRFSLSNFFGTLSR